jgi:SNF2 family DNA or RNA helicase
VIDLVAADTVDEKILAALERKENLAARLSTARLRELLT